MLSSVESCVMVSCIECLSCNEFGIWSLWVSLFFAAIQYYRRAVQLVPDIEFRIEELKSFRKGMSSWEWTFWVLLCVSFRVCQSPSYRAPSYGKWKFSSWQVRSIVDYSVVRIVLISHYLGFFGLGAISDVCTIICSEISEGDLEDLISYFHKLQVDELVICQPEVKQNVNIGFRAFHTVCLMEPIMKKVHQVPLFQGAHLSHLPVEVLIYIFKWVVSSDLDVQSLENLALVSCLSKEIPQRFLCHLSLIWFYSSFF